MPVPTDTDTDFLDEIIEERSGANPAFTAMVDEAYERRLLLRKIAEARKAAQEVSSSTTSPAYRPDCQGA